MKRIAFAIVAVSAVAFGYQAPKPAKPSFTKDVKPMLASFCNGCHTGPMAQKRIDLGSIKTDADAAKQIRMLKKSFAEVSEGEMPPKGQKKPSAAQIKAFGAWIKAQK